MEITGFPALIILAVLPALTALPVKISASMFGSPNATFLRSFMALFLSLAITMLAVTIFPPVTFFAPLILVFVLMRVLDIGFFGAIGVAIMTAVLFAVFYKSLMALISPT